MVFKPAQSFKNVKKSLSKIPPNYRRWLSFGVLVAILVALPLSIWGLMTSDFDIRRAATGELLPTPVSSISPSPSVSPSPSPGAYGLDLKLKFAGVTSRPNDDSDKRVQIYATSHDGGPDLASENQRLSVVMKVNDNGVYHAEIGLPAAYFGHRYRLRVKGPKHLQAVFSDVLFQSDQELDLTVQLLRPGDLNGDKKVDGNDLQLINERIFFSQTGDVEIADVNFDQKVDIIDRTLVLNTLSVYYDPD